MLPLAMFSFDLPPGTTIESLMNRVFPELHARSVGKGAPADLFVVTVRLEGFGAWTVRIQGSQMKVEEGEAERPILWMYASELAVERFLDDALGPRRLVPRFAPVDGLVTPSDPRLIQRVALASGRIALVLIDDDGERLTVAFGLGASARKAIDPEDADVVLEVGRGTLERVLRGELGPEDALADGEVTVRGNRFLALQLALAVAPFYPGKR